MTMKLSIQGRLTAWYAGALLVALAACGLGVYSAVVNLEMAGVDEDLRRAASTVTFGMMAEAAEGLDLQAGAIDTEGELSIAGIAVAMYDGHGHLLAARWEGLEPVEQAPKNFSDQPETIRVGTGDWRRLLTRSTFKNSDYLVLSASPLEPLHRHAALVRSTLFAIIPITIALAAAGGWLSARLTLRPISRLAAEANQVSYEQPRLRLSVPSGGDELTSLATAFNSLLQRLQTAHESQRQFMADASHELRTPVSVIRSSADVTLSQAERSPAEYRDSIGVIADQAKRLSRLVEDLFLLARADVKGQPLSTTRFYLDDVLSECAKSAEILGAAKQVRFEVSVEKDVEIQADEDLVRRMLMNLFENAVRHNPPGTRVVAGLKHAHQIEISVRDDGRGVPSAERDRIFERFVRLDTNGSVGAGLGLPIARWIAVAHGGSLVLAESTGPGSLFVVRLPA